MWRPLPLLVVLLMWLWLTPTLADEEEATEALRPALGTALSSDSRGPPSRRPVREPTTWAAPAMVIEEPPTPPAAAAADAYGAEEGDDVGADSEGSAALCATPPAFPTASVPPRPAPAPVVSEALGTPPTPPIIFVERPCRSSRVATSLVADSLESIPIDCFVAKTVFFRLCNSR